ncbi:hypothetical protein QUF88_15850 [Bacillus sp. DX1.1]|uniref:hypothetical protein n=1 Tax=unclassified Bacillus (in: firmicutes) TaxID=185979 RepID=UPI00257086F1|nr:MULTISPECIES: hypothetical protein [unclassified Bacillus (in: firmicutes)]MDM5155226.1 hypothetical protein [Bacillus sp. DX1.1]WJE79545.1 hypothetical protein QRE67_13345 [Bacillus sp. DX3.1]
MNFSDKLIIGELIAVSRIFELNAYDMLVKLENGSMELFETKKEFLEKYSEFEIENLNWCELNNGKVFTKLKEGKQQ